MNEIKVVMDKEHYMRPAAIVKLLGIKLTSLKYYRKKGYLKKIKWTPGKGSPLYEINEVKAVFNL